MPNPIMWVNWLVFIVFLVVIRKRSAPAQKNRNTLLACVGYLALHALFYTLFFVQDGIDRGMCSGFDNCWEDYVWVYWIGPVIGY